MKTETHENKYLKHCLNCESEVTSLDPDHIFCDQCGYPIRNECTNTGKYNSSGFENEPLHQDEEEYLLEPTAAFCPKCSAESLFNQRGLIEVKHPKVEIIKKPTGEIPFPF
ncbi:hypothetical protein [Rummeliibacillus sp. TYF-LIM-RU47]|uniref:hypothetical protein n=1 Tax=Rummeliibacillus sp. TYF-LIM-RU47 TaxID=2608406 RepID=UPI00123BE191|nr:hypothetical protein [Rummeliibacillus sp. TYF-LIM-RU47]